MAAQTTDTLYFLHVRQRLHGHEKVWYIYLNIELMEALIPNYTTAECQQTIAPFRSPPT